MRLKILKRGHRLLQKAQLFFISTMMGFTPGPIAVLSYRRNFFGKHYNPWLQHALREAKYWSVGEIELFGTFVSKQNQCQYCANDHHAIAKMSLGKEMADAVLQDFEQSSLADRIKVVLRFLKKLSLEPHAIEEADFLPMITQGLSKEAIEEVIHVCGIFCVINRLADAFDFKMSPDTEKVARFLLKNGYAMTSLKG
ncbi:MAG: peroxidase-related enzyme [Saprospiraceae bacterium]|nr:peroxidase-related enzyme [Saprospiraceae bacterium]